VVRPNKNVLRFYRNSLPYKIRKNAKKPLERFWVIRF